MNCWKFPWTSIIILLLASCCFAQSPNFQSSPFDFGVAPVGQPAGAGSNQCGFLGCFIQIMNTGTGTLTIDSFAFSSDTPSDFSEIGFSSTNSSIAPGQSGGFFLFFTPTTAGLRSGTLVIQDNAPGSPHQISLTGTGIGDNDLGISPNAGQSSSSTIAVGASTMFNLAVAAGSGFNGTVSLSCTNLPTGATCSFPCSLSIFVSTCFPGSLVGPQLAAASVSVTTTSPTTQASNLKTLEVTLFVVIGIMSILLPHRTRMGLLIVCVCVIAAGIFVGCGGGPTNNATPAGTHTFTVVATSGNTTRSTQLTLMVQ